MVYPVSMRCRPFRCCTGCRTREPSRDPFRSGRSHPHQRTLALASVRSRKVAACLLAAALVFLPTQADVSEHRRLIPEDKQLDPVWLEGLSRRGIKEVFSGEDLETISMPCGGIGAGQLYLCGDGTLGNWEIFNRHAFFGHGEKSYARRTPAKPLMQAFTMTVEQRGRGEKRALDRSGFDRVEFRGEYPVGIVRYRDDQSPVEVDLEAFSPFIPLNARDSALPLVFMQFTLRNTSAQPVRVRLTGLLENGVCSTTATRHAGHFQGVKRARVASEDNATLILYSAYETAPDALAAPRIDIVFEDFEAEDYGEWSVVGDAFGARPSSGTNPNQQPVSGFHGKGLVNSYPGSDVPQGMLVSPSFTVSRRYVNFLIGGGGHADRTCMNLLVDGHRVRTATGAFQESLAWKTWNTAEFEGKQTQIQIVDHESGGWGHVNADHIVFSDTSRENAPARLADAHDYGAMALCCLENDGTLVCADPAGAGNPSRILSSPSRVIETPLSQKQVCGIETKDIHLKPRQRRTITFALAWHFPNAPNGHHYAAGFADAASVIQYALANRDRLIDETRLWRDTYYDSTLPYWLLDRLHSTVSCLATGTCLWWKSGRFYGYEGVVCCPGACTHVWNYAHAHARLFPELARSVRELQDFCPVKDGGGFHDDTGLVGFRSNDAYAADGQCGTVLKAYREHLMSADDDLLRRNWMRIRKAVEYCIAQDEDEDGLIENSQHNTYDINFEGPNTFVGALYLAALRAGEEMATEMGDIPFADRLRGIFETGRTATLARLWNGEYFVQEVDLARFPQHQYGPACLSDQLFGQNWAHQVGLGHLYPKEAVVSALRAVWRYNWAPDVGPYNAAYPPLRRFADPGEAGLLVCTWPLSEYLLNGVIYKDEVWTGIEYQVAAHMIWEGLVQEGLAICRAVHDRYHPSKRNPYNEVECGDHYARALAAWGVYLAASGFEYHGPKGHIGFDPRLSTDAGQFRTAFTAAEGWGTFTQSRCRSRQTARIEIKWGRLRIRSISLGVPDSWQNVSVRVRARGAPVESQCSRRENKLTVRFGRDIMIEKGEDIVCFITPT